MSPSSENNENKYFQKGKSHDEEIPEDNVTPELKTNLTEHKYKELIRSSTNHQELHNFRIKYFKNTFRIVIGFLTLVVIIVIFSGIRVHKTPSSFLDIFTSFGFEVADKVLITFIASTTLNVIGLLIIAFKWLFNEVKDN